MQKNKSFQKGVKPSKQKSHSSSRALLELSQITVNSKEKSCWMQNFTERSGYPSIAQIDTTGYQKGSNQQKQKAKSQSQKQNYLRKNISISNSVLNQIMQMSNSLPIKSNNFQSAKIVQKENDLIILSKNDLQKSKNLSQTKKSKKLLLYETKQNHHKTMSKPKSSFSQIIKAEPVVCSIQTHPLQEQRNISNISSSQKKQSFDGRRSSFSSRRSSINLFSQEDSQVKMNQIKKSFLAKVAFANQVNQIKEKEIGRVENFLTKCHSNSYAEIPSSQADNWKQLKQTRQNQTQVSPRQKKQIKERYMIKLDELSVVQEDIKKNAPQFLSIWNSMMESQKNLRKYKKSFEQAKTMLQNVTYQSNMLKNLLFQENKKYVLGKRISSKNFNCQKQGILFEVEKIHTDVKKKVFKKDLEDIMVFNMKVVLPSSQMMDSSLSCLDNHINSTINYSNITVLQLYEELMNQKACKKYGMILKKQINNMNIYDNRAMNEYLKKLCELQSAFNRVQGQNPQGQNEFLKRIQELVEKIEETQEQALEIQRNYKDLQNKVELNENRKKQSDIKLNNFLNQISESVYSEYKLFHTGGKVESQSPRISAGQNLDQSFRQNDKTIESFRQLVRKKYDELYLKYRQVKEEKMTLIDSFKTYQ